MLKARVYVAVLLVLGLCTSVFSQSHHFKPGESLTYDVYYYLMGVWVGAGEVNFSVTGEEYRGIPCYKFQGVGTTYPRYDWFFKVRDVYTSYSNTQTLMPYRFSRDVSEGGFYFTEVNLYAYQKKQIYSVLKVKERPVQVDTIALQPKSFDVLSLLYHTRNIDFAIFKVGDKIPIRMVIDRETFDLYIRFLGTDTYEHSKLGPIECYKFSPLLVAGTLFKDGEKMTVWVSKDRNVVPIYVESEIRVGSIRAELKSYKGLMAPLGTNP